MGRKAVSVAPECPLHPGSRTSFYDRRGDRRRVRCVLESGRSHVFTWPMESRRAKRLAALISGIGFDRPACPKHPEARVWWDGFYGVGKHRRPRYKCVRPGPLGKASIHVFTEPLPRQLPPSGECYECDRDYLRIDGPQSPREYAYVAREIAAALIQVGAGHFYTDAAKFVRRRAQRYSRSSFRRYPSRYGNVVGDWVEVWAGLLHEQLRGEEVIPETVVLDDLPFHVGKIGESGLPTKSGQILFHIFGAVGYDHRRDRWHKPRVLRLEAAPRSNADSWGDFLDRIPGPPQRVITDEATSILKAVPRAWPEADMFVCKWHLWHQGYTKLAKRGLHGLDEPVRIMLDEALKSGHRDPDRWRAFTEEVRQNHSHVKPLMNWVHAKDALVLRQLATDYYPVGNGAVEEVLRDIKRSFHTRRFGFGNRERTNRLLQLIELHLNERDDEAAYARIIRAYLEDHAGESPPRHVILDPAGAPSIRPA